MSFRIFVVMSTVLLLIACGGEEKNTKENSYQRIEGLTQGTSYHITYFDNGIDFSKSIDSLLEVVDKSMSVHNPSTLMSFNNSDSNMTVDEHILKVFWKANEVFYLSNKSFDPTVKPLIDFWGFGGSSINAIESIDPNQIDSLLQFTSIEKVKVYHEKTNNFLDFKPDLKFENPKDFQLVKLDSRLKLDFNAIAQGYTVDLVSELLESQGVMDYLVEIGGEVRVKGKNSKGATWTIGIDRPEKQGEMGRPLSAVMSVESKSIATSGNYRKFYEKDGVKYSHTISSKTGYPVQQNILSATVVADDCMTADAFATAFMVMGHEKAISFLEQNKYLQGYLIYSGEDGNMKTYYTEGIEEFIEEKES